jgi:hypothetical protein
VQNLTDAGLLDNGVGDIARNSGDLQQSLNADLLDSQDSPFYRNASNLNAGTLNTGRYSAWSDLTAEGYSVALRNSALQTNLNADLLDGMSSADFVAVTGDTMTGILTVDPTSTVDSYAYLGRQYDGVAGINYSDGNDGVYGYASGSSGHGVYGRADGSGGHGVYGYASDGIGVYGYAYGANRYGVYGYAYGSGGIGVRAYAYASDGTGLYARGGSSGWAGDFQGKVRIRNSAGATVMELGEGLDYSEGFDLSDTGRVEPGAVLVLDPDHPGKLRMSDSPYDRKVAGIVAGANGLGSGVRLGAGTFDQDVALAGRVYCNVDATEAAVEIGDLLTTSSVVGHAMKVSDHVRAQGAILGKAMSRLEKGQTGQILVLVTLQ